jgi:hypothetical protein
VLRLPEILEHRKCACAEVPRVHLEHADEPAAIGAHTLVELRLQDALDGRDSALLEPRYQRSLQKASPRAAGAFAKNDWTAFESLHAAPIAAIVRAFSSDWSPLTHVRTTSGAPTSIAAMAAF